MQDPMAPGHQTRASVINSRTASETASENQTRFVFCVDGSMLMVLLQKISFWGSMSSSNGEVKPKRRYTWEKDFLRGRTAPLGLDDGRS